MLNNKLEIVMTMEMIKEIKKGFKQGKSLTIARNKIIIKKCISEIELNIEIENNTIYVSDYNDSIMQLVKCGVIKSGDKMILNSSVNNNNHCKDNGLDNNCLYLMVINENNMVKICNMQLYSSCVPSGQAYKPFIMN